MPLSPDLNWAAVGLPSEFLFYWSELTRLNQLGGNTALAHNVCGLQMGLSWT